MAFYGRHRTGGLASSGRQYGDLLAELADLRSHNAHLRERISHKRQALRSEILAPDAGLQGAAACRQCGSPLRAAPPVRAASVWSAVLPATYPTTVLPYYGEDDPDVSHPSVASLPKRTQSTQYPSPSHVRAIQQLHTDELPPDLKFSTCRDRGLLFQPQRPHPSPSASVGTQASPGVVWPERSAACHVALLATLERSLMVMEDERSGFAERERQLQRALEHATLSTARHRQAAEEVRGREAVIVAELAECRDELERLRLGPASESAGPPAGALLASPPRPSAYPGGHDECQRLLVTLQLEKERLSQTLQHAEALRLDTEAQCHQLREMVTSMRQQLRDAREEAQRLTDELQTAQGDLQRAEARQEALRKQLKEALQIQEVQSPPEIWEPNSRSAAKRSIASSPDNSHLLGVSIRFTQPFWGIDTEGHRPIAPTGAAAPPPQHTLGPPPVQRRPPVAEFPPPTPPQGGSCVALTLSDLPSHTVDAVDLTPEAFRLSSAEALDLRRTSSIPPVGTLPVELDIQAEADRGLEVPGRGTSEADSGLRPGGTRRRRSGDESGGESIHDASVSSRHLDGVAAWDAIGDPESQIFSANPSANDNVNPVGPENFPTLPTDFPEGDSDGSLSSPGAIPQHFPTLPSDFPDEDSDGTLSVAGAPQELSAGSPDVVPSHPLYTTHDTTGHDGGDDLRQFGAGE